MSQPLTTNPPDAPTQGIGAYGPVTLERFDEQTGNVCETVKFTGRIIGSASSEQKHHRGHPGLTWAPKRVKCSACRWLEVTLYRRQRSASQTEPVYTYDYVIYTVGNSDVPGEIDFIRIHQTDSAFEVVELLTVRRPNAQTGQTDIFLPPQHALALAQASTIDDDIRDAYVNRAVA